VTSSCQHSPQLTASAVSFLQLAVPVVPARRAVAATKLSYVAAAGLRQQYAVLGFMHIAAVLLHVVC
jgi:hypothetical protein